jgi:hypothetical protein
VEPSLSLSFIVQEKLLNNFTGAESQILRCPNNPSHFSEREDPISVISIEIKARPHTLPLHVSKRLNSDC